MVAPLSDIGHLERIRDAGVGKIAINIELWDPAAAADQTPGKHRLFGRTGYLRTLAWAVEVFDACRVRSLVVAGLEPMTQTLRAIETLAEIGVMPVSQRCAPSGRQRSRI
jgi:hypothetical protein